MFVFTLTQPLGSYKKKSFGEVEILGRLYSILLERVVSSSRHPGLWKVEFKLSELGVEFIPPYFGYGYYSQELNKGMYCCQENFGSCTEQDFKLVLEHLLRVPLFQRAAA
jgi:hypothetical protein